ncbi:MAG: hypothetical protein ABIA59_05060, partial [Candidatus Latescibacterota bacterium]
MARRPNPILTAFWIYVIPMTSTRAFRIGIALFLLFTAGIVFLFMSGFLAPGFVSDALIGMRHFLVMAGLPVGAVLLSEIPIRDGITHRTLLYPLLGPMARTTHALVRLIVTSVLLAFAGAALLLLIRIILKDGFAFYPRELLSVTLGAFAYISLFGFVHLYNRRGLIAGLAIFFLMDLPLGKVPFSIRNMSPSYHMGVIAGQEESLELPIMIG